MRAFKMRVFVLNLSHFGQCVKLIVYNSMWAVWDPRVLE